MSGLSSMPPTLRRIYGDVERETEGVCQAVLQHICGLGGEHTSAPLSPLEVEEHRRELEDARECIRRYILPADPQEYLRKYMQSPYMRRDVEIKIKNPVCDVCRIRQEKALAAVQAQQEQQLLALQKQQQQLQPQIQQQQQQQLIQQQQEELLRSQQGGKKKGKNMKNKKKKKKPPPSAAATQQNPAEVSLQNVAAMIEQQEEEYKTIVEHVREKNPLRKSLWYCPDCARFLCGGCDAEYHAGGTGNELHNRQTLGQFIEAYDSKTYGIGNCKDHPRQPVQVFCRTCNAMICLICTLELHARHELYSAAYDSFDLDQLTPAELTRENLYATLLPMVRCSTSPAKAFAIDQRERYAKRCLSKDELTLPQLLSASSIVGIDGTNGLATTTGTLHSDKMTEVCSCTPLPESLEGVKVECALNFVPYAPVRPQYPLSSLSSLCAGMGRVGDNALAQALRAQRLNFSPDLDSDLSRQVSAMESYLSDLASSEALVSLTRPQQQRHLKPREQPQTQPQSQQQPQVQPQPQSQPQPQVQLQPQQQQQQLEPPSQQQSPANNTVNNSDTLSSPQPPASSSSST